MQKFSFKILAIFMVLGCSENKNVDKEYDIQTSAMELSMPTNEINKSDESQIANPNISIGNNDQNLIKKIIYSARIKYRVLDLKNSDKKIRLEVEKYGGYISGSTQNNDDGSQNITLTIRIPTSKFQNFIDGTENVAIYTDYKTIEAEDISAEYYDNELRIKSKKLAFEKYLALLKQAKNVTEVLAVEEQLRIIREEIEAKEGRQKFLDNQVEYSTINLQIYQIIPEENKPNLPILIQIWEKLSGGFQFFISVIIGTFYWIPFIIVGFLVFLIFKKWRLHRKD